MMVVKNRVLQATLVQALNVKGIGSDTSRDYALRTALMPFQTPPRNPGASCVQLLTLLHKARRL